MKIYSRQFLLVQLFIAGLILLTVYSYRGEWAGEGYKNKAGAGEEGTTLHDVAYESYFKHAKLYLYRNNTPLLYLNSKDLSLNSLTSKTHLIQPEGLVYSSNGQPIHYESNKGILLQKAEYLNLIGQAKVVMDDGVITSHEMKYWAKKDELRAMENVVSQKFFPDSGDRMTVNSDNLIAWPESKKSEYIGHVNGNIKRKRPYQSGISFRSNKLALDGNILLATLLGDVFIRKQGVDATSQWGEIFLENYNKKLKYFVLYDDVKVTEKVYVKGRATPLKRKAFSEKLEGFMAENKLVLTGYPKVYQASDVIKGNKVTLRQNNEVVEVDDANTRFYINKK